MPSLNYDDLKPREYQLEALEAVDLHRSKGINRQLISLPTGTGKTVVFSLIAKQINTKTLVLAHSEELINQAVSKFQTVWPGVDIGVCKAERDEIGAQVVVASVQTATRDRRLQRLKEQGFGLLIIDEAHHSAAPSYENVIRELGFFDEDNNRLLVGVTATPKRGDGIGLKKVFQEIVFERSISTMIKAGYLAPLVGMQVHTRIELQYVGIRNGDFISSELSRIVNTSDRNQLIVDNYGLYAGDRKKALAFCVDVQHAKDLAETFTRNGIPAKAVYGAMSDDERKETLAAFSNGEYSVLTNCQLLTEGFDEPSIDCVIMGRPTQSTALFTQMIGRGTRTFPLKKNCLVLDFTDNASKHELCTYKNTLDGAVVPLFEYSSKEDDEGEFRQAYEQPISEVPKGGRVLADRIENIEFFNSTNFAWNQVGDSWHLCLASDRDVWVRKVESGYLVIAQSEGHVINLSSRPLPLDYALGVAEDWSRKQTTKSAWARKDAAWRAEPATPRQRETLTKFGFTYDGSISKGEAATLLDSKFSEPATEKQVWWLKSQGIPINRPITKFEARKMISNIRGG